MTCKHECFIGNRATGHITCAKCGKPKAECETYGIALIEWNDNWNGGALMMKGDRLTEVGQLEPTVEIRKDEVKVGEGTITGTRSEVGSDEDHGHTYSWTAFDFNITLPPTGFGVNVRQLVRQGFEVYGVRKE